MEVSELAGSTAASTSGTVHGVLVGDVSPIKTSILSLSRSLLLSLSSLTSSTSPRTLLAICNAAT